MAELWYVERKERKKVLFSCPLFIYFFYNTQEELPESGQKTKSIYFIKTNFKPK